MSETRKRAPAEDAPIESYRLEAQVGHLLRRAHQRATSIFLAEIGDETITPTQFAALVRLFQHGELPLSRLGRLTAMDPATVQGVVRRLVERNLLETRSDPRDRRRTLARLTAGGHETARRLIRNGPTVSAVTLAPLTPAEQAQFLRLLEKLT